MAFQFESNEFKKSFDKVTDLARIVKESGGDYTEEVTKSAQGLLIASQVFNTNINLSQFDEHIIHCTKKWDGFNFVNLVGAALEKYNLEKTIDNLENVLLLSASFVYIYFAELTFQLGDLSPSIGIEVGSFNRLIGVALKDHPEFSRHIDFGDRELPYAILKDLYHSAEIKSLNDLNRKVIDTKAVISEWESKLELRQEKVNSIAARLDTYKDDYNFVLLNKGFKNLYDQKKIQLSRLEKNKNQFFWVILGIPIFEIISFGILISNNITALVGSIAAWYLIVPSISLLIFLFYFYRINLQDIRSTQSQMMQLELRMALCQFIHNYAEDSETLHKKNKDGFEKFENIIFSPIVSSDDKIPTTFDGVDQLAQLISAIRGK